MASTQTSTSKKSASRTTAGIGAKKTLAKKVTASSTSKITAKTTAKTTTKKTAKTTTKKTAKPALTTKKPVKKATAKQLATGKGVASAAVSPEERYQMIAAEAYLLAESRGFESGHALDDWIAAEAKIDALINA